MTGQWTEERSACQALLPQVGVGQTAGSPGSAAAGITADRSMATRIAWLLIFGVTLSAMVLAAGVALLLLSGPAGFTSWPTTAATLDSPDIGTIPHTLRDVLRGTLALRPLAVIQLGVLLLIATPVMRVAASVLLFLQEGDWVYTAITLAVLLILLWSLFGLS